MSRALALALMLLLPASAQAQLVPEGIHSLDDGPASMCGMTGVDAADLAGKVRSSTELTRTSATEYGDLYVRVSTERGAPSFLWLVTNPPHSAHPSVACLTTVAKNGILKMNQTMRCDSDRAACDALFLTLMEQLKKLQQAGPAV